MSDAVTNLSRSTRSERTAHNFLETEKDFLAHPTQKNLCALYAACEELSQCPSEYFGRSSASVATSARSYFEQRFSGNEESWQVQIADVAFFLAGLRTGDGMQQLADVMTRMQGVAPEAEKYDQRLEINRGYLGQHLTVMQVQRLEGYTIERTTQRLEIILQQSGIKACLSV